VTRLPRTGSPQSCRKRDWGRMGVSRRGVPGLPRTARGGPS
jgi:hypothetical protein